MKLRKIVFAILFLFINTAILGQSFVDILNLDYSFYTPAHYENNKDIKLSSGKYKSEILLPVKISDNTMLLFNNVIQKTMFHYDGLHNNSQSALSLMYLFAGINSSLNKNKKWKYSLLGGANFYSDMKDINSKHFQYSFYSILSNERSKKLTLKYGVYFTKEPFKLFITPLIGLCWHINQNLNVFGELPLNMNIEYKIAKRSYANLEYKNTNGAYMLSGNDNRYFVREGDKFFGNNQLVISYNYHVKDKYNIKIGIGHTFYRFFETYNNNLEKDIISNIYQKTRDTFLINIGLSYRIRI
ncbi:MAG: hypothetical protein A2X12_10560 [Bacteroidetes bacterium GWE2_29_8]|nr:MAG: hypothetical protein A2X12_10560 [Bacteroidetes bacterium GWE2_29_8]OFY23204.1 MAG: hypothetical protein A2X02_09410 [Bacteroidetes bacterium GWF2_29_10]